ncbi:MAG: SLBB domain-containing protein [Pseudomonadota bacterium]
MKSRKVIQRILGVVLTCWFTWTVQAAELTPEQRQLFLQLSPAEQAKAQELLNQRESGGRIQAAPAFPDLMKPRPVAPDSMEKADAESDNGDEAKRGAQQEQPKTPQGLKPFGYDLFAGSPTTFAPATDIPVPAEYIVGPGDMVQVQLFGKDNAEYTLPVGRDGTLNFPGIGPVPVAGLRFPELKDNLMQRVEQQLIGVRATISLGPLRSIRIFVLGDVQQPGSYTVSGLSTMTNALFVSGGVKPIGSLRNIQLKRNGEVITRLDLYDLLLRGDTRADARLQPGDVIFVPPVGATVGVDGEVKRPAIYEIKQEKTLAEALAFSGGLLSTAYPAGAQLERINNQRERTLLDVNLSMPAVLAIPVQNGDVLRVRSVLDNLEGVVLLTGHVQRPGGYQWREGMRLSNLITSPDELLPKPDLDYVVIKRELKPDRRTLVFSSSLRAALDQPGSSADVQLSSRDEVLVFGATQARGEVIEKLVDQLSAQASLEQPAPVVTVDGNVRFPGKYPLEANMRVSDLLRAGGQLGEAAYALEAELTRYGVVNGEYREVQLQKINLGDALAGKPGADVALHPHDHLNVKEVPQWAAQGQIKLSGEVRFPGTYPIRRGETLSSVIARAGGLTDYAYADGAVFMREELRRREQEQLDALQQRLQEDLARLSLQQVQGGDANQQQELQVMRDLSKQLERVKAAGRLVIDLPAVIAGKQAADVALKEGDALVVPAFTQEVTVIGEVFHPTSHLYRAGIERDEYINSSGGLTKKADDDRIYVVRANGAVMAGKSSSWFQRDSVNIKPGDTIVVPLDVERLRPLTLWTSVSQIVYQFGLAIAAWNTVGVL